MKMEGSPSEVGCTHPVSEAASAEAHPDDHFSDDEPETELEALTHLPPEERRKALRRLRNRESARRVRARRLAEMSQMGTTLQSLQDENATLKGHVNKLQSHIQSMTLKVYEVTAKYESAVADNAQLRAELFRYRRPSAPGDSSYPAPAATGAATTAAANGPNSAPLQQVSPFISPMELAGGCGLGQDLSPGLVQLRSSSPMDLQQQRQALEEVVMLLKEHKRRNQGAGQDRSGGSEIGSTGAGGNMTSTQSPASDSALPRVAAGAAAAGAPLGGLAASCLATNNSSNCVPCNVMGSMGRFQGSDVASGLNGGRVSQSEILTGTVQHQAFQAQVQARLAAGDPGVGGPLCTSSFMSNVHSLGQQQQGLCQAPLIPSQLMVDPGPAPSLSLPLPGQQQMQIQMQQQGSQALGQSHSHTLTQLPATYSHNPFSLGGQQQPQQTGGSGALYGNVSSLSLSAPFHSVMPVMPVVGGGGGSGLQTIHGSGPNALGSGVCGLGGLPATVSGPSGHHRSASYALDRSTCGAASVQNAVLSHPTWQVAVPGAATVPGFLMRPEDFTEDLLMSLDEYVPQDL